ncbi:unnamed protein product [Nezara viridula]|uniref:Uncharacterized protein n=1 Tax=Nezara viridula TaxID=85310 RepID=A0A9P0H3E6_NEZVI|nr:unnamed protein product [Nezara viridula]
MTSTGWAVVRSDRAFTFESPFPGHQGFIFIHHRWDQINNQHGTEAHFNKSSPPHYPDIIKKISEERVGDNSLQDAPRIYRPTEVASSDITVLIEQERCGDTNNMPWNRSKAFKTASPDITLKLSSEPARK